MPPPSLVTHTNTPNEFWSPSLCQCLVDSVHLWSNILDKQTPNDRNPTISVIGTSHLLQLPHLGYLEYLLDTDHQAELAAECSAPPWLCCWVHLCYLLRCSYGWLQWLRWLLWLLWFGWFGCKCLLAVFFSMSCMAPGNLAHMLHANGYPLPLHRGYCLFPNHEAPPCV